MPFMLILIIVLIIINIILSILKKKNIINLKFNNKIIIIILLIFLVLYSGLTIYLRKNDITFFFDSLQYNYINKYDYSNDIANNGYISKTGAIKIAKEKINAKRVTKVTSNLVENGTYIDMDDVRKNLSNNILDLSKSEKQATYWVIGFSSGWDYECGHEEDWIFLVDYYTGKILSYDVTM